MSEVTAGLTHQADGLGRCEGSYGRSNLYNARRAFYRDVREAEKTPQYGRKILEAAI